MRAVLAAFVAARLLKQPQFEENTVVDDATTQSDAIDTATDLSSISGGLEPNHFADPLEACDLCFNSHTKANLPGRCTVCASVPIETDMGDGTTAMREHFVCLPGTDGAIGYVREKEGCVCAKARAEVTGEHILKCDAPGE